MDKNDDLKRIEDNLKKGKLYTSIANFLAALLFFIAYHSSGESYFFIAGIILMIAGIGVIIVFSMFQRKFCDTLKKNDVKDN